MAHITNARFPAMGTTVHVQIVDGDPAIADRARERLAVLESQWSRFQAGSDTSRLNRSAGQPVLVSWETRLLLQRAVAAAAATEGRFDPTVGAALIAHGYDRTFAAVGAHAAGLRPVAVVDAAWPAIEIDHGRGTACLPDGTVLDPGGIGKGLAADLVAVELADQANGILINIGGDARMCGTAADPAGWVVAVDDPFDADHELVRLALPHGAIATSSKRRRRWTTASGGAHHIIDPRTGRPAAGDVAAVTVIAAEAWWAEVQATSLFLEGPSGLGRTGPSIEALVVLDDGTRSATAGFTEVLP